MAPTSPSTPNPSALTERDANTYASSGGYLEPAHQFDEVISDVDEIGMLGLNVYTGQQD
jgi:hypothetical protein